MYIPKTFEITEQNSIFKFIKENAFGQLTSLVDQRLFSTHLPFLLSEEGSKIICHLARKNPQWLDIADQEVMITFTGPHDYISPSWYSSPGVPTWNYQAVHVYGKAKLINDTRELKTIVDSLTEIYEASFEQPWKADYNESMLNAIVGIEIEITQLQAKYKLSQNRSESDQKQVIDELIKIGSRELSEVMKQKLK